MASVTELKKSFDHLIQIKALSHAYLFFGDAPAAQERLARGLARRIEAGEWSENEASFLDGEFLDARNAPGIESARSMIAFLWQKPFKSERRMFMLSHADALTVPAQQAILKIAEEPPAHALIVFLTNNPDALIAALASRFQKIFISGEPRDEARIGEEARRFAVQLVNEPTARSRTEIIKAILEEEKGDLLREVVAALFALFGKNRVKYWSFTRELLKRWALMNQYNVNKKLQLEAVLNLKLENSEENPWRNL